MFSYHKNFLYNHITKQAEMTNLKQSILEKNGKERQNFLNIPLFYLQGNIEWMNSKLMIIYLCLDDKLIGK